MKIRKINLIYFKIGIGKKNMESSENLNLNFIVDYNMSLFYIVNCWSKWDIDVNESYYNYFKENLSFNEEDDEFLKKFAAIRIQNKIGWDSESELASWASHNFPSHEKFDLFKPILNHFESKTYRNGENFGNFLKREVDKLETLKLQKEYEDLDAQDLIRKLCLLNPEYKNLKSVNCYLVYGIDKGSGGAGANGGDMIVEISPIAGDAVVKDTASKLVHEYIHIAVCIKKRLLNEEKTKDKFNIPFPGFEGRNLADLFEELFAYSVCNTLIDHYDASKKIEKYSQYKQQIYREAYFWWSHVDEFGESLKDFINGKTNPEECLNILIEKYLSYLSISNR